jgi:hypothetical protein
MVLLLPKLVAAAAEARKADKMEDNTTKTKSKPENNFFTIPAEYLKKETTKAQYLKIAEMYGGEITKKELRRHSTASRATRRKWIKAAENAEKPTIDRPLTAAAVAKAIEDWSQGKSHKFLKVPIWALDVILKGKSGQGITCLLKLITCKQIGLVSLCKVCGWNKRELLKFLRRQKWIAIYRIDDRSGANSVLLYRDGKEAGFYDTRQAAAAVAAIAKGQELRAAKADKAAQAKGQEIPDRPVAKDKPIEAKTAQEFAILAAYLVAQKIASNGSRAMALAQAHPEKYGAALVWYEQQYLKNAPQAATAAENAENEQEHQPEQKPEIEALAEQKEALSENEPEPVAETIPEPELISADSAYFDEPPLNDDYLAYSCGGDTRWQLPEQEPETMPPPEPASEQLKEPLTAAARQWQEAQKALFMPYFETIKASDIMGQVLQRQLLNIIEDWPHISAYYNRLGVVAKPPIMSDFKSLFDGLKGGH